MSLSFWKRGMKPCRTLWIRYTGESEKRRLSCAQGGWDTPPLLSPKPHIQSSRWNSRHLVYLGNSTSYHY